MARPRNCVPCGAMATVRTSPDVVFTASTAYGMEAYSTKSLVPAGTAPATYMTSQFMASCRPYCSVHTPVAASAVHKYTLAVDESRLSATHRRVELSNTKPHIVRAGKIASAMPGRMADA